MAAMMARSRSPTRSGPRISLPAVSIPAISLGSPFGVRPIGHSEKVLGLQWVQFPPGNWVAPAGSYRGGGGGNEIVGAFETDVSLKAMQRTDRP